MSESDGGASRIKVVDRRHFDESGDLRPDRPLPEKKPTPPPVESTGAPDPPTPPAEAEAPRPETQPAPTPEPGGSAATSPMFLDLIAGLAQQAEILMVGGQGIPAQPAEAQRVIEYLSMLENKTTGNLSTEETQVLSNVIFQLRALYVQHNK